MLKDGKPQRNAEGKITKAASYQSRDAPVARIEPNRKWFGNTRVISQEALSSFREAVAERASDPYSVLLKTNKLPMSLIRDDKGVNGLKQHQAKMAIENNPFSDTFGPKAQRKRVKLGVSSLADLAGETAKMHDAFVEKSDHATYEDGTMVVNGDDVAVEEDSSVAPIAKEAVFLKGQSKRIWNELYKVIDSSDVVIHLLDARDPEGTRCKSIEKYIREEAPHKHLIFVLNKCDLVPTGVAVSLSSLSFSHCNFPFSFDLQYGPSPLPSLSQGASCDFMSRYSLWETVCYSFGRLTLVRADLLSEARLIGFRFESRSLRTELCSVFELSPASALEVAS